MLSITAVSAGAVDYLLRGSGCAEHAHAPSKAELGLAPAARQREGAQYLLASAELEPAGVWYGHGLHMVGMAAGSQATARDVRAVFGKLTHPTVLDPVTGKAAFLGRPPRQYKSTEQRIALALAAEPDASEGRVAELTARAQADDRKAVAYYDLTFSPVKSVSVYHAAMLAAGRPDEAAKVLEAHRTAIGAAMEYVEKEAAYTRTGYHGKTVGGRSVGRFEQGTGLVWVRFDHSTSRAQEPQIHSHVGVLNKIESVETGKITALDGRGFAPIKAGAEAIYRETLEREMTANCVVVFATRADGKTREILGISRELLAAGSTRRGQVLEQTKVLVGEYVARHGREPGPAARKNLTRQATLMTRDPKVHTPPGQQIASWTADKGPALHAFVSNAADWVRSVARHGHPDQRGHAHRTREQVLQAAVDAVQVKFATWDVGNLQDAIEEQRKRTPTVVGELPALVAEVLRRGAVYGVVGLTAPDRGQVPAAVQRTDGKSRYRMHNDERYATVAQLATEVGVVARARELTAPVLAGPELELARVELVAAGLGSDQQGAVLDILSSGRAGDVLIGPAGAGKSRTVGALAGVWEAQVGGRVLGLATSQIATSVLADDGLEAVNTTVFVHRFTPDQHGRVADHIRVGDLVVLDEAGTSTTTEVDTISRIVAAGGGKLLYTGDPEQLGAVGAGGMLDLLVRDTHAVALTEIHRFHHEWERDASVRLRIGDTTVLEVYAQHGRLRGGTREEMVDAAVRGYLADTLTGKHSLLVVGRNEEATELSGQIRAELVRLGRVEPEVLGQLRDTNLVGVGDLIQARHNDRSIRTEGPGMVTNRDTYRVLGRDRVAGDLRVQDKTGMIAHLPQRYVANHVTLAYAVTGNSAQSLTVDTSHPLIDRGAGRAGVYVPATRGRECNTLYVVSERDADHHNPQRLASTARTVLEGVLGATDTAKVAAELARRVGEQAGQSLASVGTQWDLLTAEYGRDRYTDTLLSLLPAGSMDQVEAEPGYGRLMHAVREAELVGHDPTAVLTEAVEARSLAGAGSVSDVLRWRVHLHQDARTPEREVRCGDWAAMTAPMHGPVGDYARTLADHATTRQAELGAAVAEQRPAWALEHLGPPPADERQHVEWVRRAGIAAAYRDLRAVPDTSVSLGAAPSREQVFHRVLWQQAYTALGAPADALDYATATDTELRGMREAWRREETWGPHHVGGEIQDAREMAEEYRRDAVLWRAEAELLPPGSPAREEADSEVAHVDRLGSQYTARVEHLQVIHTARERWDRDTEPARTRSEYAAEELEHRGLSRDGAAPVGEQVELFAAVEPDDTHTTEREQAVEPAPQQQQRRDADTAEIDVDVDVDVEVEVVKVVRVTPQPDEAPAPAQRREAVLDGPSRVAAHHEVAVEESQGVLFAVEPDPADVAAAQPLRASSAGAPVEDPEQGPVTVGQARRHAEISAALHTERSDWTTASSTGRDWQTERDATDELDVARTRRDQTDHQGPELGRELTHGASRGMSFGA